MKNNFFSEQIGSHLYNVYFGGNWTLTNFKEVVADVTLAEALEKHRDLNTIATLVFHTNYFLKTLIRVLDGKGLTGSDKFSFDHPSFSSEDEWRQYVDETLNDAKQLSESIKKLSDDLLMESFADNKYGSYNRNLWGVIEHCHYHLGQIVVIKKLLRGD